MYVYYVKDKDCIAVQNSDMNCEIFENTNNIDFVLETKNNIEIINNKMNELDLIDDAERKEEIYLKKMYLESKSSLEEKKLDFLLNNSTKVFSDKKTNKYINNYNFIKDLDNKLKLIDFYLEIRYSIINKLELNIMFNKKENQRKKLMFINLCLVNINDPENFIKSLLEDDNTYSINKQKKLK